MFVIIFTSAKLYSGIDFLGSLYIAQFIHAALYFTDLPIYPFRAHRLMEIVMTCEK